MQDITKIYSPKDAPYGPISIYATSEIEINGVTYPSVANFVYSSMLTFPLLKARLKNASVFPQNPSMDVQRSINNLTPKRNLIPFHKDLLIKAEVIQKNPDLSGYNIRNMYYLKMFEELQIMINKAYEKGYEALVQTDKDARDVLLSTGNRPLSCSFLANSFGFEMSDPNMIGRAMEKARFTIKKKFMIEKQKETENTFRDNFFVIFKLMTILDLSDFSLDVNIGDSAMQVIDTFSKKHTSTLHENQFLLLGFSEDRISNMMKSFQNVTYTAEDIVQKSDDLFDKFEKGAFPKVREEFNHPGILLSRFLVSKYEHNISIYDRVKRRIISDTYISDLIFQSYPNLSTQQVKDEINKVIYSVSVREYRDTISLICNLYYKDQLPEGLISTIKAKISELDRNIESDRKNYAILTGQTSPIDRKENPLLFHWGWGDPNKLDLTSGDGGRGVIDTKLSELGVTLPNTENLKNIESISQGMKGLTEKNRKKVLDLLQKYSEKGYPYAMMAYADLLESSNGNPGQILDLYEKSSKANFEGRFHIFNRLSELYSKSSEINVNPYPYIFESAKYGNKKHYDVLSMKIREIYGPEKEHEFTQILSGNQSETDDSNVSDVMRLLVSAHTKKEHKSTEHRNSHAPSRFLDFPLTWDFKKPELKISSFNKADGGREKILEKIYTLTNFRLETLDLHNLSHLVTSSNNPQKITAFLVQLAQQQKTPFALMILGALEYTEGNIEQAWRIYNDLYHLGYTYEDFPFVLYTLVSLNEKLHINPYPFIWELAKIGDEYATRKMFEIIRMEKGRVKAEKFLEKMLLKVPYNPVTQEILATLLEEKGGSHNWKRALILYKLTGKVPGYEAQAEANYSRMVSKYEQEFKDKSLESLSETDITTIDTQNGTRYTYKNIEVANTKEQESEDEWAFDKDSEVLTVPVRVKGVMKGIHLLSPYRVVDLLIGGARYSSVFTYVMATALCYGGKREKQRKEYTWHERGRNIEEALELLQKVSGFSDLKPSDRKDRGRIEFDTILDNSSENFVSDRQIISAIYTWVNDDEKTVFGWTDDDDNRVQGLLEEFVEIGLRRRLIGNIELGYLLYGIQNNLIQWNDPSDPYLGVGRNGDGMNIVGIQLMNVIKEALSGKNLKKIKLSLTVNASSIENVKRFIVKNTYFQNWIRNRAFGMCTTVSSILTYMSTILRIKQPMSLHFVRHVLDIIYSPCSDSNYALFEKFGRAPPEISGYIFRACEGFEVELFSKKFDKDMRTFGRREKEVTDEMYNVKHQLTRLKEFPSFEKFSALVSEYVSRKREEFCKKIRTLSRSYLTNENLRTKGVYDFVRSFVGLYESFEEVSDEAKQEFASIITEIGEERIQDCTDIFNEFKKYIRKQKKVRISERKTRLDESLKEERQSIKEYEKAWIDQEQRRRDGKIKSFKESKMDSKAIEEVLNTYKNSEKHIKKQTEKDLEKANSNYAKAVKRLDNLQKDDEIINIEKFTGELFEKLIDIPRRATSSALEDQHRREWAKALDDLSRYLFEEKKIEQELTFKQLVGNRRANLMDEVKQGFRAPEDLNKGVVDIKTHSFMIFLRERADRMKSLIKDEFENHKEKIKEEKIRTQRILNDRIEALIDDYRGKHGVSEDTFNEAWNILENNKNVLRRVPEEVIVRVYDEDGDGWNDFRDEKVFLYVSSEEERKKVEEEVNSTLFSILGSGTRVQDMRALFFSVKMGEDRVVYANATFVKQDFQAIMDEIQKADREYEKEKENGLTQELLEMENRGVLEKNLKAWKNAVFKSFPESPEEMRMYNNLMRLLEEQEAEYFLVNNLVPDRKKGDTSKVKDFSERTKIGAEREKRLTMIATERKKYIDADLKERAGKMESRVAVADIYWQRIGALLYRGIEYIRRTRDSSSVEKRFYSLISYLQIQNDEKEISKLYLLLSNTWSLGDLIGEITSQFGSRKTIEKMTLEAVTVPAWEKIRERDRITQNDMMKLLKDSEESADTIPPDEVDPMIANALLGALKNLYMFKREYVSFEQLTMHDIDLVVSLILQQPYKVNPATVLKVREAGVVIPVPAGTILAEKKEKKYQLTDYQKSRGDLMVKITEKNIEKLKAEEDDSGMVNAELDELLGLRNDQVVQLHRMRERLKDREEDVGWGEEKEEEEDNLDDREEEVNNEQEEDEENRDDVADYDDGGHLEDDEQHEED